MSVMDHPDLAPSFAKAKPRFAAGQTWRKAAMFLQDDVEVYSEIVGGMRKIKSWRPGIRWVQVAPDDHEPDCDGDGYEVREIAAVVNIPDETPRILYRRHWVDPDGKAFGKRKMQMTTPSAFSAWINDSAGYRAWDQRRVAEMGVAE